METVGVQAVVQGLSKFVGDIGKLNSSLKSIDTSGNIVSRALEGVSGWFSRMGQSMLRVAEIALGVLVRDAFLAIINGLKDIIADTIEAGNEFQILELRLSRLNLNALTNQFGNYSTIMQDATDATQEQLKWVQKLAATTPYDFQDIANVFTLARSYGFADEAARGLTEDISDFAAGMGLGNQEIERIIVNMGQMVQQGKVTQREMNDLARGAFVPVNDVLKRMQENVGMTDREFEAFRYTGEGVNAFMEAFSQIVQERFSGASEAMARTFKGATDNVKDFIKSIFGFGIVTPILDKIGGKIADTIAELTTPERFDALTESAGRIGDSLGRIVERLFNLTPGAEGLADKMVEGLNRVADWLEDHETDIVWFFIDLKNKIKEVVDAVKTGDLEGFLSALGVDQGLIDKIISFRDTITGTLDTIKGWIEENKPTIDEFFGTLGEIVGTLISNLTGQEIDTEGGISGILDAIKGFMDYVIENKDLIAEWVTKFFELWAVLQLVGFVLTLILPPISALVGLVLGAIEVIAGLVVIFFILTSPITLVIVLIGFIIAAFFTLIAVIWIIASNWEVFVANLKDAWYLLVQAITDKIVELQNTLSGKWNEIVQAITDKVLELQTRMSEIWNNLKQDIIDIALNLLSELMGTVSTIKSTFTNQPWGRIGRLMIDGIRRGVQNAAKQMIDAVVQAAEDALNAVAAFLGIQSPSVEFMKLGRFTMVGFAEGIEDAAGLAARAMQNAVTGVMAPAMYASAEMGGMVSTQNNYAYNYNLTVNSSAGTEAIVQDYNMLQSMAGA